MTALALARALGTRRRPAIRGAGRALVRQGPDRRDHDLRCPMDRRERSDRAPQVHFAVRPAATEDRYRWKPLRSAAAAVVGPR
ncbi:hypothetical protein [Actinacidiphila paucisporea]|uniref:Uncharacterized protein n=1 Tax=Actinacidiphila paucisporea TaxID=310782 RepID=A0A1M6W815_9ACTN|nr:hypothetical protein [Actinacidiphila paucisporea]SHK89861.1 hypothetical protein SAMN05216499_10222 [Actinacidiphila paucisporea]